jgi:hypothetical protein
MPSGSGDSGQTMQANPSGLVGNSLADVLYDCLGVLTTADSMGNHILDSTNAFGAAWTLAGWVWNQYWQEDLGTKAKFAWDVFVGQSPAIELLTGWAPIVGLVDMLSGNVQGGMQMMFTDAEAKVFMNALAANAHQPAPYVTGLGKAWALNAQALPNALDPAQTNSGNNGGGPNPGGPGPFPTDPYTSAPPPSFPGGPPPGPGSPNAYTPLPNSGNGSLASFNPNGLGAGGGLGSGAGLGAADGLGAGGGLGSGLDSGAGAGAGAGRGMPMMPAGGPGGGKDDKARNRTVYLSEDEDVWGAGGDDSDGVL